MNPLIRRRLRRSLLALLALLIAVGVYNRYRPLPPGLSLEAPLRPAAEVSFLADLSWVDETGARHSEQAIFDEVFRLIAGAERFILVDMFLFNAFQGAQPELHRRLSTELTARLLLQKQRHPKMQILVITDPLNTLYGGLPADHLARLERAGIPVTYTRLAALRDSNPGYSALWRSAVQWFGNGPGGTLPNPMGPGRVSARSYLALLNFKANHRKVVIADAGGRLAAVVGSANPHDGSSAHGNVALRFAGPAVADLLESERAVLAFSGGPQPAVELAGGPAEASSLRLRVLTERGIERGLIGAIEAARPGDRLDLAVFYLSDRHVIEALRAARRRGVMLRVLLDPNKDAFGRRKNGVPNRPVAAELVGERIPVRWCDTHGEQCHAKFLLLRPISGEARLIVGSANYTRRNLDDLNLESSVELHGPANARPLREAARWFERRWNNEPGRRYSTDYARYAEDGWRLRLQYRVMEATGLSTF